MTRSSKYNLISFGVLLITGFILYFLVKGDADEKQFYSSGKVVTFTQWLMLLSGGVSLTGSALAIYYLVLEEKFRTIILKFLFFFPCMILSALMVYAALLFVCCV